MLTHFLAYASLGVFHYRYVFGRCGPIGVFIALSGLSAARILDFRGGASMSFYALYPMVTLFPSFLPSFLFFLFLPMEQWVFFFGWVVLRCVFGISCWVFRWSCSVSGGSSFGPFRSRVLVKFSWVLWLCELPHGLVLLPPSLFLFWERHFLTIKVSW